MTKSFFIKDNVLQFNYFIKIFFFIKIDRELLISIRHIDSFELQDNRLIINSKKYHIKKQNIDKAKNVLRELKEYKKCEEDFLNNELKQISKLIKQFKIRYIQKKSFNEIENKFNALKQYNLSKFDTEDIEEAINLGFEYHQIRFVEQEKQMYKDFFDKVEKNPLTKKQREACIIMEQNNLVLAGAGTGKTSVMLGRAEYLIKYKNILPNDILMITFTKSGVNELQYRISKKLGGWDKELKIKTFHSLCLEISGNKSSKVISEDERKDFILEKLNEYSSSVMEYMDNYFYEEKDENDFYDREAYFKYIQTEEIRTYKKELVKSHSERRIANWLTQNGIKYEYEKQFIVNGEQVLRGNKKIRYYPDFYLPDYDIWIEFFGLDVNGNTRADINKKKYIADRDWKAELHQQNNTKFIELYYADVQTGNIFKKLETQLKNYNVKFSKKNKQEIWDLIKQSYIFNELVNLVESMLHFVKIKIYKFNIESIEKLTNLKYMVFFKHIFNDYQQMLKQENKIDFTDMLLNGMEKIRSGKYKKNYKHILVDEFQDTSDIQADLIKLLRDKNGQSILCCIGDDWQSIYRFQGGDVRLITEFEKNFGNTSIVQLDQTFRFNQNILNIANNFIMQNPQQLTKDISSIHSSNDNSLIILSYDCSKYSSNRNFELSKKLGEVINTIRKNDQSGKIMILSRNNRPFDGREFIRYTQKGKCEIKTIHSSKGLEAEYVIIIGIDDKWYGIPSKREEKKELFELVPKQCDGIYCADERRLFYVALTRAKKKVYLITDANHPSEYIEELLELDCNNYLNAEKFNVTEKQICKCGDKLHRKSGKNGLPDYWQCHNKDCIATLKAIK